MTPKPRKRPLSLTLSAIELLKEDKMGHHPSLSAAELLKSTLTQQQKRLSSPSLSPTPSAMAQENNADQKADATGPSPGGNEAASAAPSTADRPTNSLYRAVEMQLELLGDSHVGFGSLRVPNLNISIVGARPFAKGGSAANLAGFYDYLYGISTAKDYTARVVNEAMKAAEAGQEGPGHNNALVLMAHNGPLGLGREPHSICGVDW